MINQGGIIDWVQPVNLLHPLNRGLVAWWLVLPGMGGTRLQDLMKRNDGILTNMDPATDWVGPGDRPGGWGALDFDDTDDYIKVADEVLCATLEQCTASIWFRTTNTTKSGGWAMYTERAASGNDIFKLDYGDDTSPDEPSFTWRNDGGTLVNVRFGTVPAASDGKWHNLVITISGSAVNAFYDSVHTASDTLSTKDFTDSGLESRIGGDKGDSNANWGGRLDDCRLHNVAWTAADVAEYYELGRNFYPGILNRWRRRVYSIPAAAFTDQPFVTAPVAFPEPIQVVDYF